MSDDLDRSYLTFRLLGEFDPEMVTDQMGIEPTDSFRKGDLAGKGVTGRRQSTNGWFLHTNPTLDLDIELHLEQLLGSVEPKAALIEQLRSAGVEASVMCFWSSPGAGGGPWIKPGSMGRLAALELPLIIGFYSRE